MRFSKNFVERIGFRCGLVCLAAAVMPHVSPAMPTKTELAQAEKIVAEVMSPDVAAFKAGTKSAAEVASAALGYVDEAQGEAAKYLLLKGALQFQVRAADFDGAVATAARLRVEVSDLPDQTLADVLSAALRRVPRKQGGSLYALLDRLQWRVKIAKEIRELERQTRANPADKTARVQLGERYAMLGDWKEAIKSFASGDGKFAEMAQWEQLYPETGITDLTTAKVADFWWEAGGGDAERTRAYRVHAAYWYRKAIENGSLPGLRKPLAEKRIAEAEKENDLPAPQKADAAVKAHAPTKGTWVIPANFKTPLERSLKLADGVEMAFCACPAGSFNMSNIDGNGTHQVRITRPFWIGKWFFSVADVKEMNDTDMKALSDIKRSIPDMKVVKIPEAGNISPLCALLNAKYGSQLPAGYVFRMPTEAELEYALTDGKGLGGKDCNYVSLNDTTRKALAEKDMGWCIDKMFRLVPKVTFGKWGLSGIAWTTCAQMVLDTVDSKDSIIYSNTEIDPVRVGSNMLGRDFGVGRNVKARFWKGIFRLVIGPDLIAGKPAVESGKVASSPVPAPTTVREAQNATQPTVAVKPAVAPTFGPWAIPQKTRFRPVERTLKLANGVEMTFCACPAGTFDMSNVPKQRSPFHKVTITRPFWISKQFVTSQQNRAIGGTPLSDDIDQKLEKSFPKNDIGLVFEERDVNVVIFKLTERFGSTLPKGYVFRLPTEAELEYAVLAGGKYTSKVYVDGPRTRELLAAKGLLGVSEKQKSISLNNEYRQVRIFERLPLNPWNIIGGWTDSVQVTLDRVDIPDDVHHWSGKAAENLVYAREETDPLRFGRRFLKRQWDFQRWLMANGGGLCRVCVGPDLMKEKGVGK